MSCIRFPVAPIVFKPRVELHLKPSAITSSALLALSTIEILVLDLHTHIIVLFRFVHGVSHHGEVWSSGASPREQGPDTWGPDTWAVEFIKYFINNLVHSLSN